MKVVQIGTDPRGNVWEIGLNRRVKVDLGRTFVWFEARFDKRQPCAEIRFHLLVNWEKRFSTE